MSRNRRDTAQQYICTLPIKSETYSIERFSQWSCHPSSLPLPAPESIKSITIVDFDNTLFRTPLPNTSLWGANAAGSLQQPKFLINGGWWHDERILAACGEGVDIEKPKAWKGHWNEEMAAITELSIKQRDSLTVLLTGRNEKKFSNLIYQILESRNFTFDMVVLKPAFHPFTGETFESTITFKLAFLEELLHTYSSASEMCIYEDRSPHCKAFRDFAIQYNNTICLPNDAEEGEFGEDIYDGRTRCPIEIDVVQVAELQSNLNPLVEVTEVQKMVNDHNLEIMNGNIGLAPLKIRKTIFYTGYMLSPVLTAELLQAFANNIPSPQHDGEIKYLANSILIVPRPCPKVILEKVGGMGAEVEFVVTAFGSWADKIWAVKVEPTDPNVYIHTETPEPAVILAHRRTCRPMDANRIKDWQAIPPHHARIVLKAVVGERMYLKIDEDHSYDKSRYDGNLNKDDDSHDNSIEHTSGHHSYGHYRGNKRRAQDRDNEHGGGQSRGGYNNGGNGRGRLGNRPFRGREKGGFQGNDLMNHPSRRW